MSMWTVYDLDVWGNAEDGWDVNDWRAVAKYDDNDRNDIITFLYCKELITTDDTEKFVVDEFGENLVYIFKADDMMPLFSLEKEVEYRKI